MILFFVFILYCSAESADPDVKNIFFIGPQAFPFGFFPLAYFGIPSNYDFSCASYTCKDGRCLEWKLVCDGIADCIDGADESPGLCKRMTCPPDSFQCNDGQCIPMQNECNGKKDCLDGSDEKNCVKHFWTCNDGLEIPSIKLCDGRIDCYDSSDESYVRCKDIRCEDDMFKCSYGACIPLQYKCNGIRECHDGTDEELCHRNTKK